MANNIILNIGSHFNPEGLNNLNKGLASASGNVKKVSATVGQVIGSLDNLGGTLGKTTQAVGGLIGNIMQFGIWGGVIAAVGAVTNKFLEWRDAVAENKKVHKEFIKSAVMDWDFYDARAQRSLDARAAREKAEALRLEEQARREREANLEIAANSQKTFDGWKARERELEVMKMELGLGSASDGVQGAKNSAALAEARARANLQGAKDRMSSAEFYRGKESRQFIEAELDVQKAELQLALVLKSNAEAIKRAEDAAKKEAEAREKAAEMERKRAEDAAKKEAEAKKKEAERERIEKIRGDGAKAVADIDKKLADARQRAAELEEQAAKARGKTFNQWNREVRQENRQKRREEARTERRIRNAMSQIEVLEAERRRNGRGFNPQRAAALARLREFVADQNPANNPALKLAEQLEKQKLDLIAKTNRDIADISARLKDATTL